MNQNKNGKFITKLRKEKNLTQEQLAEKMGVSINAVSKWERGILLFKWHRYYFDVNTFIFSVFFFKIRDLDWKKYYFYIQKVKFVHTFCKCKICSGARKIVRNHLFIKILKFRGVFSYPVAIFVENIVKKYNWFHIISGINILKYNCY